MNNDQLHIIGAPASWQLKRLSRKLVTALRKSGFVPERAAIVLSVSCVGSSEMSRLNARYRGKRGPTDVLSFEQPGKAPRGLVFLGDLVLCREVVRTQARAQGHGVQRELCVLLAHGLLHLLGYDHERSAREDARMARAEQKLLKSAGLATGLIARSKVST